MIHLALFGIDAGIGVLLTYLAHSTIWIAAALLLTRSHRRLSPAACHALWRAALVGPFASSALAPAWCRCWEWSLAQPSPGGEAWIADLPRVAGRQLASALSSPSAPRVEAAHPSVTSFMPFVVCWAVVALVGLLLLARAAVRQHRALESRAKISDTACLALLDRLAKRMRIRGPVRLSRCTAANTPFVLNAREICLPERALALDGDALEAVLAHELAHIERRDGLWLNSALLLQALLWFQPLNRKVRSELQETAELAADDRAVELTGNALGLARTLTEVASWVRGARFVPAVTMARAGSIILVRVARLCDSSEGPPRRFGSPIPWLALAALAAVGACSPSIGPPHAQVSRGRLAPASPLDTSTEHGTPEPPAPGVVDDAGPADPRMAELAKDVTLLVSKQQQLERQIENTESCGAAPVDSAQTRGELAILKQELAVTARQRQQLEHYLHARMQAWSAELEQRFERDRAALTSAWGSGASSLLECF